jgi:hypothetical protein
MKTRTRNAPRPLQLQLLFYNTRYYVEWVGRLEAALARRPRTLQIDLIGGGEVPADTALLIRSVLRTRSSRTHVITHARSSLQGGSVLVWLSGDRRLIRDDARVFFRRANVPDAEPAKPDDTWKDGESNSAEDTADIDPEEGDYARVLQLINEFLPVKELTGRLIEVPVLRQFGLVDHEKVDHFLATAFRRVTEPSDDAPQEPEAKTRHSGAKTPRPRPVRK